MPNEKPNKTETTDKLDDLEKQANAIAAAGAAEDGVLMAMAKGMTDAISMVRDVLSMRKGDHAEPDGDEGMGEGDGDEGGEPDGDEGEGEGGEGGEGAPGYATMSKAEQESIVLDATNWIQDVGRLVHDMSKAIPQLRIEIAAIRRENAELRKENAELATATIGATTALAKALGEQHTLLKAIPAAAITPARARLQVPDGDVAGPEITRQALAKAHQQRILTSEQINRYMRGDGRFEDDDAANADLIAKLTPAA